MARVTKEGGALGIVAELLEGAMRSKAIQAALLALQGVIFLVAPEGASMDLLVQYVAATVFIAAAAELALPAVRGGLAALDLAGHVPHLVAAVAAAVVWLFPGLLAGVMARLVAVACMTIGVVNLWHAGAFRGHAPTGAREVTGFVISVLILGLGVAIVFQPVGAGAVATRLIGLVMVAGAVSDLWLILVGGPAGTPAARSRRRLRMTGAVSWHLPSNRGSSRTC